MSRKSDPVPRFDPSQVETGERITVSEAAKRYVNEKDRWCKRVDGRSHADTIADALRSFREAAGEMMADEVDWQALFEHVQYEHAIQQQLARSTINDRMRVARTFGKWLVKKRYVPASAYTAAASVEYLRYNRSPARETHAVGPVSEEAVFTVAPYAGPVVEAMIALQYLTGMRPGEVCILRPRDLEQDGDVLVFTPARHKTEHMGRRRAIFIGPRAQTYLRPFLLDRDPLEFCFSPVESELQRRADERRKRQTPDHVGQVPGSNRRTAPKRKTNNRYTTTAYARAVRRACEKAIPLPEHLQRRMDRKIRERPSAEHMDIFERVARGELRVNDAAQQLGVDRRTVSTRMRQYREGGPENIGKRMPGPRRWESWYQWRDRLGEDGWAELKQFRREHHFTPNQLRHGAATRLRAEFGIEAARTVLGHADAATTEIYAEQDKEAARKAMAELGLGNCQYLLAEDAIADATADQLRRAMRDVSASAGTGARVAHARQRVPDVVDADRWRADAEAAAERDRERQAAEAERRRAELADEERRDELLWSQLSDEQRDELHRAVLASLPAAHPGQRAGPEHKLIRPLFVNKAIDAGYVDDSATA